MITGPGLNFPLPVMAFAPKAFIRPAPCYGYQREDIEYTWNFHLATVADESKEKPCV